MKSAITQLSKLLSAEVERLGGTVIGVEYGAKHPRLIYDAPDGRRCVQTFAGSPHNLWRAGINARAEVRRAIRGDCIQGS